jgi:hypothetical protein
MSNRLQATTSRRVQTRAAAAAATRLLAATAITSSGQKQGKPSTTAAATKTTRQRRTRTTLFCFLQWFLLANGIFQISVLTARSSSSSRSSKNSGTDDEKASEEQPYQPNNVVLVGALKAAPTVDAAAAPSAPAVRRRTLMGEATAPTRAGVVDLNLDDDSKLAIECRYDGHCPVGRTCAVAAAPTKTTVEDTNPERRLPGRCLEIPTVVTNNIKPTRTCLDACRRELEMDEHWFHETWPEIVGNNATSSSSGRPAGCVLYYKRTTPDRLKTTATSIPEWEALRFRHVVRVDPAQPNDASDDTWMAYCTEPCTVDRDCQPTSPTLSATPDEKLPFVCQQGACQRNSAFWEAMTVQQKKQQQDKQGAEMVIVTGATLSYFPGLQNLLGSIRYWAPHVKVVVYNLGGLEDVHKNWIRQQPNLLSFEWQDGIPDRYPPHMVRQEYHVFK